ncbi:maleylpyruvate isomerase family mycothiol-dependent enzyme [Streptomyces sp. NPDC005408]|uniref:maleylpyruvate isomerase family mycothiol-dependent enzyme n=1 Tax=Streptomyces sp. NPDC005408 TaxID=3155341 RepID=UPI0033B78BA3
MAPVAGQDVRGTLPEGLGDAIRGTAEDIAALLRGVGDTSVPVPGSEWSVGAAAAHLAQANELMADIAAGHERAHGDGTAQSLAAANERALAEFDEREAGPLAEMIVAQAAAFLTAADRTAVGRTAVGRTAADERSAEGTLATPLGPMSQAELGSYLLTHMLGHGYDLARALGRPHMIDRTRVELSLPFLIRSRRDDRTGRSIGRCSRIGHVLGGGRCVHPPRGGAVASGAGPLRRHESQPGGPH